MSTVIHNLIFHHFLWTLGALAIIALAVYGCIRAWKGAMFLVLVLAIAYAVFT